ncbi:hypothetical protein PF005_g28882 [Phytophthora fragariae]|nr:hypothetical protein PF003_g11991 [Phytophthora fragariae]KAE8921114.1 hypothetical protein PF009_g28599 [Phytophthora fragariae]KAE8966439.1 hypothetical protein PF011_g27937 [Phytophthora fragariae]KAE9065448.1 hypothetical protein PF007_g28838 [Phytophthora fragariae]KAE9074398.1 hypothetical protein PF006_g28553 [Phytophthora fragariae]
MDAVPTVVETIAITVACTDVSPRPGTTTRICSRTAYTMRTAPAWSLHQNTAFAPDPSSGGASGTQSTSATMTRRGSGDKTETQRVRSLDVELMY